MSTAEDSGSFKLFADESYLDVEAVTIAALTARVAKLDDLAKLADQAKDMDRGHSPDGILCQARSELKRATSNHARRKASVSDRKGGALIMREAADQRKAAAATSAKRKAAAATPAQRKRASRAEAVEDSERLLAVHAKLDLIVDKRMEEMKASMMDRIKELREGGLDLGAAFAAYSEERAAACTIVDRDLRF